MAEIAVSLFSLSLLYFFVLGVRETSQFIHSFFHLSAGMKGSGWELRHLTSTPGGGGALDSVIL